MSRAAYEIRAVGEVPPSMVEDFEGVTVSFNPAGSTIHAVLADEAELHGLLDALSREGYVLVDVRREVFGEVEEDDGSGKPPPADPPTNS